MLKTYNGDYYYLIHRISFSFILFLPKYKQIIFNYLKIIINKVNKLLSFLEALVQLHK